MANILEEFEDKETICSSCKKKVMLRSFIIKDSKPYRFISCADCQNCGLKDTFEEDYQVLDYGVKVICKFDCTSNHNDLRRMTYIHRGATVIFMDNNEELFSFSSDRSNVDCVEGMWLRGKEILEADQASSDRNHKELIKRVEDLLKSKFTIVIKDDAGYSKVCPYGMEYAEIESKSFEELNSKYPEISYEKYSRNESKSNK